MTEEMSISQEKVVTAPSGKKVLAIRLKRVSGGLLIELKSDVFENFFKYHGANTESEPTWEGNKAYKMPRNLTPNFHRMLASWGNTNLSVNDNLPNLSFLRAVGLGEGVKFIIPMVFSKTEIMTFKTELAQQANKFFQEYMKPISVTVEIITTLGSNNGS